MAEEKKKKGSLKRKVLTWIIVLGISVTFASVLCGIFIFKHEISEVYNTEGYQIAATTEQFYGDDMKRYTDVLNRMIKGEDVAAEVEEIRSSERYKEIHDLQETLRRQMEVNDIYVCVVDYDNLLELQGVKENGCLYYVMDCYYMEEEEFAYGHVDNVNLNKMDIVEETWRTGIRTDSFIMINGKYGYNTTAFYPVLNEEGKTIAAIGVEVPMSTLQTDMAFFMLRVSLVSIIVVILIIWLMSASITRRVI
nr:hypothetical protein [Lachnospiraceae bacterium]